jgi:predicted transcriptional regulator
MNFRKLERIVKGVSNHRRIEILNLLKNKPELSLSEISDKLKINFKTAGEHVRRLVLSGLVMKRHENNYVRHKVTKQGESMLKFLRTLE